jgi:archaellum component FlaF (FlaF/FlaG flagellin family)
VIFASFVIIFGVMFQAVDRVQHSYSESLDQNYQLKMEKKDTSFIITEVNGTDDTVTLLNQGSVVLDPTVLNLMVEGAIVDEHITQMEVHGHNGSKIWAPEESLTMHLSLDIEDDARIKVVSGNGISAYHG